MPKSANLSGIKSLHNYTIQEAANITGVSERTIRTWIKQGMHAMANERPTLVRGDALTAFIKDKRKSRKSRLLQDEFYCLRCHAARKPAGGFVDCETVGTRTKLTAICEICETIMHRPIAHSHVPALSQIFDLTLREEPESSETKAAQ